MAADTFVSGSGIDVCRNQGVKEIFLAFPKAIRLFRPSSKHIYSV